MKMNCNKCCLIYILVCSVFYCIIYIYVTSAVCLYTAYVYFIYEKRAVKIW